MKLRLALTFLFVLTSLATADVKLAPLFQDHMVLQRDASVPVWGTAKPGETVELVIDDQHLKTKADAKGNWQVTLKPLTVGKPRKLVVEGSNRIEIKDVLVGEVWICSGQSNMAWTVDRSKNFPTEKANAKYPQLRMFSVARQATPKIQTQLKGSWQLCTPETVGKFSATAYFFGREVHKHLDVPVGLVNTSWGGTDVAAWTSLAAQKKQSKLESMINAYAKQIEKFDAAASKKQFEKRLENWRRRVAAAKKNNQKPPRRPRPPVDPSKGPNRPANLFNGMVNPLIPYAAKGVIWYQGERNSKSIPMAKLYEIQLQTLITDWRARWKQQDLWFFTVQLPNFRDRVEGPVQETGWVTLRESQAKSLALPQTGLAITLDIGEAKDIHPKNKQDVGKRLALSALAQTYGKDVVHRGPFMTKYDFQASVAVVRFAGSKLKTNDDKSPKGFAIAGKDKVFHQAQAIIKGDSITLSSPKVKNPVAVRYAWKENPEVNLVGSTGLPAAPFRTDNW